MSQLHYIVLLPLYIINKDIRENLSISTGFYNSYCNQIINVFDYYFELYPQYTAE